MSEKNEALRLAKQYRRFMRHEVLDLWGADAAAELRRLSAENEALRRERDEAIRTMREAHEAGTRVTAQRDALLEALELLVSYTESCEGLLNASPAGQVLKARAAIKAVKEGK